MNGTDSGIGAIAREDDEREAFEREMIRPKERKPAQTKQEYARDVLTDLLEYLGEADVNCDIPWVDEDGELQGDPNSRIARLYIRTKALRTLIPVFDILDERELP